MTSHYVARWVPCGNAGLPCVLCSWLKPNILGFEVLCDSNVYELGFDLRVVLHAKDR